MLIEAEESMYIGHKVFYDTAKEGQFTKKRYTIPWKFVIDITSSSNVFKEEKFTCAITTVNNISFHIVGGYKQLNESFIKAHNYDKF